MQQIDQGRQIKDAKKKATERGIPVSKKNPPTVQQEDMKYIYTKTNRYQSDFGVVQVTRPKRAAFSKTAQPTGRKPQSFFDPSASIKRAQKAAKEQEEDEHE